MVIGWTFEQNCTAARLPQKNIFVWPKKTIFVQSELVKPLHYLVQSDDFVVQNDVQALGRHVGQVVAKDQRASENCPTVTIDIDESQKPQK